MNIETKQVFEYLTGTAKGRAIFGTSGQDHVLIKADNRLEPSSPLWMVDQKRGTTLAFVIDFAIGKANWWPTGWGKFEFLSEVDFTSICREARKMQLRREWPTVDGRELAWEEFRTLLYPRSNDPEIYYPEG